MFFSLVTSIVSYIEAFGVASEERFSRLPHVLSTMSLFLSRLSLVHACFFVASTISYIEGVGADGEHSVRSEIFISLSSSVTSLVPYIEMFGVTLARHAVICIMSLRRVCDGMNFWRMEVGCRRNKGEAFRPNLVGGIRANRLSRQRTPIADVIFRTNKLGGLRR